MDGDELALCMEYCEGGSLDSVYKRVSEKGMSIPEKVLGKISEAVLNGLVYLHKVLHVMHRGMSMCLLI
jgi:serine/threonine protein kinase